MEIGAVSDIVTGVREKRFDEKGVSSDLPGAYEVLFGECDTNSTMLIDALCRELCDSVRVKLVVGGVSYPGESAPRTAKEAMKNKTVHYWVVVEHGESGRELVCDVCSESDEAFGELIVQESRPSDYIEFERLEPRLDVVKNADCVSDRLYQSFKENVTR